jgi:hypothetical protein
MKNPWLVVASLFSLSLSVRAFQANTPQGALEEIATADKPEILVRHLPEPIQKKIEALPRPKKLEVLAQLMQMKAEQFDNCTVRPSSAANTWEIVDQDGSRKGTVTLENAFISGLDALLPLHFNSPDSSGTTIVTLHLEDSEWRIQSFGQWLKSDAGLTKLLHEPTEIEQNEEAAKNALLAINSALANYARFHPKSGYPSRLKQLILPSKPAYFRHSPWLDESYAADPLIISGYEFSYLLIMRGNGPDESGTYELRASPLEFAKSGVKSFLLTSDGPLRSTRENRPATEEDSRDDGESAFVQE